jgi:hypothetical protein
MTPLFLSLQEKKAGLLAQLEKMAADGGNSEPLVSWRRN